MLFSSMITYITTVTLVRIAILLLYRRIFDVNPFRTIAAFLIAACVAWGVSICAANIFQCHRVPDAFRPEVVGALDGRCIDLQAMFYGTLGTGFTLDLVILALPFQQIWTLRLERRQKYELTAILGLGGLYVAFSFSSNPRVVGSAYYNSGIRSLILVSSRTTIADVKQRACLASIMRIVALGSLEQTDLTCRSSIALPMIRIEVILCIDSGASTYMWSQIEPSAAILCACFITYRPLFRDVSLRSIFSKSSASSEPSDVSRRFPTARVTTETSSEAGFVEHKGSMGYEGGSGTNLFPMESEASLRKSNDSDDD